MARCSAHGIHPSKRFPLTWPRLAVACGTRAVQSAMPFGTAVPMPACRLRMCRPSNQIAVSRIRPGFWALLPLRIRQSPAVFGPRAIRCSPGFSLAKDFPLPASIPSSRVIRSRTCAAGHYTMRLFPQRFACGKVSFPSPRPSISVESRVRDAALSEVSALVFRHEQRHAEPVR